MEALRAYNNSINSAMSPLDQPIVAGLLKLFLVLYGGLAAPHLPNSILKWFDFVPFRLFVLFLIIWTANKDPATAILVAVVFFVSLNTLAGKKPFEKFELDGETSQEQYYQPQYEQQYEHYQNEEDDGYPEYQQ